MQIRILTPADALAYRTLRLRSLQDHPEAFLAAYDEDAQISVEEFSNPFRRDPREAAVFGAFLEQALVGTLGVLRESRAKAAHKARIWGMYVAPEARRRGIAAALLKAVMDHARTCGVELVQLSVNEHNPAARALYVAHGFLPFGMEPDALRLEGRSFAEEHLWCPLSPR